MDDDGGLGIRNWGYYDQSSLNRNLRLQLMSSVDKRDTKPFLSGSGREPVCMIPANNTFLHRDCGVPENQISMDFVRESWMTQRDKFLHGLPNNQTYAALSEPSAPHHSLHILPQPDSLKDDKVMQTDEATGKRDGPLKKRSNGQAYKTPKVKKTKKVTSKDESKSSVPKTRPRKQNTEMVINGIDFDISGLPIPVCSCTGAPQQCYKWGIGGWQSACCTTSISMYPLPMSTKRRGARIAGRKMSQGAFKKVLEKLASEGHNLSHPIDLKTHWAKHGTNKFVTIR